MAMVCSRLPLLRVNSRLSPDNNAWRMQCTNLADSFVDVDDSPDGRESLIAQASPYDDFTELCEMVCGCAHICWLVLRRPHALVLDGR